MGLLTLNWMGLNDTTQSLIRLFCANLHLVVRVDRINDLRVVVMVVGESVCVLSKPPLGMCKFALTTTPMPPVRPLVTVVGFMEL
jgi:hypothetical protein